MEIPQLTLPNGAICNVTGFNTINVIVGKNGCGKSSILKAIESFPLSDAQQWGVRKYITPERGGVVLYEANVESNLTSDPDYMRRERHNNQAAQFRQQSVAQYRKLELSILREAEKEKRSDPSFTFDLFVNRINELLDNIEIRRDDPAFKIFRKGTDVPVEPRFISSGESELISLAIECLVVSREVVRGKHNLLLLDEPDVHLHPDLQSRLIVFLKKLVEDVPFTVIIATHSTAILGELSDYSGASVAFMKAEDTEIQFEPISEIYRKILPVFGAHPLSNVFNTAPVLLVEGEDDERIWQQTVRTSQHRIKLYPVVCGSVDDMLDYEKATRKIAESVYDRAKAFSLRDRDESSEDIDDLLPVVRMKLSCRAAENLLLCDDVLASLSLTWDQVKERIDTWLSRNQDHSRHGVMKQFADAGFDRKTFRLKDLRNLLVADMLDTEKPWEILVGQQIARLHKPADFDSVSPDSMLAYLGRKTVENLIPA